MFVSVRDDKLSIAAVFSETLLASYLRKLCRSK